MFIVKRSEANPLISPLVNNPWEASAAFNWSPIKDKKLLHVVYRAVSEIDHLDPTHRQTSVIAHATSKDGEHFVDRAPFITPDSIFDAFGCEDPRVTKIGGTYYTFYTALSTYPFSAPGIRVAVALSKDLETVTEKHLVTPFNAKAMVLFPEKVNGKYCALLTVHTDQPPSVIAYAEFNTIDEMWSPTYWKTWYENLASHTIDFKRHDSDQVEIGAVPLKTKKGWLVIYSHIGHYSDGQGAIFGIEALLLDLNNPRKIIGRTKGPFMVPETYYEKTGHVPNIAFPSGALIDGDRLDVYYGAADTHCARASLSLSHLLRSMSPHGNELVTRFAGNPILAARTGKSWEEGGVLNPAAIDLKGKVHLLYRAATTHNASTFGYASSKDGYTIDERPEEPVYKARMDFEGLGRSENMGCEDPRLVEMGKKILMTYIAYDGATPRIAISSITTEDFLKKRWDKWSTPETLSEPGVPNKDCVIIPEKIKGKYYVYHRAGTSICADTLASLDASKSRITKCIEVLAPRRGMWDSRKVGMAGPLIKTKKGWLALYHGISEHGTYRVGAALFDLKEPTRVISRTVGPIFEPTEDYELKGVVNNVVFPCGTVCRKGIIYIYYGAADKVTCMAKISLDEILDILTV